MKNPDPLTFYLCEIATQFDISKKGRIQAAHLWIPSYRKRHPPPTPRHTSFEDYIFEISEISYVYDLAHELNWYIIVNFFYKNGWKFSKYKSEDLEILSISHFPLTFSLNMVGLFKNSCKHIIFVHFIYQIQFLNYRKSNVGICAISLLKLCWMILSQE